MAKLHKNTATRQLARIAAVQAEREVKNAVRRERATQQAFKAGVEELAVKYGINPEQFLRAQRAADAATARANSATVAPSRELVFVGGEGLKPCKAVHALCATIPDGTRAEMLQLCKDNGINNATAATQVGKFRAAANAAKAEQQSNDSAE